MQVYAIGGKCRSWRNIPRFIGVVALMTGAYGWGKFGSEPQAFAQQQQPGKMPAVSGQALPAPAGFDGGQRWVAVLHGNVPVTREDFGEYLIARHSEKLELLVNKRIIELAAQQRRVEVSDAEVEAALAEELKSMQVTVKDFCDKFLKQYGKTLYEWKEDVIRPRLMMTKMCKDRVQITEDDFRKAFEAYYGEKVECRIILYPSGEEKHALQQYAELRRSDEDFDRISKLQASPTLAATGGRIQPIGRYTTGNEELEKEAFTLQPGDISKLIGTPEGTVVMKCVGRKPADTTKKLETERVRLEKEIRDKKTQMEIPKLFKELSDQAQAKVFIKKQQTQADLEREVAKELQPNNGIVPAGGFPNKPPSK